MEQKQTAVEWFAEQIIRKHPIITQYLPNYNFDKEIIKQAKEMEKEQIMNAFNQGMNNSVEYYIPYSDILENEQYYNQEYGK